MALSRSRDPFICYSSGADLVTFFDCHRRAFAHFGGVPATTVGENVPRNISVFCCRPGYVAKPAELLRFASTTDSLAT